jgi:hypothetical protein
VLVRHRNKLPILSSNNEVLSQYPQKSAAKKIYELSGLDSKVQPPLKTLRYKVFAIGGYLTKNGNARVLKLSLAMRRSEWFTGLWDKSRALDLPAIFPSHLSWKFWDKK